MTTIGNGAFNSCTGLTEVTIPNSVTTIGNGAFNSCTGLTEVTIPNSVTTIGDGAFDSCTGLQKVIWNARNAQDLQDVLYDNPIFPDCDQLTDFVFGEEVEHIPGHLCYKLRLLNTIIIPNSVTAIGERAFSGCTGLTTMSIGNSVTAIGERAFYNCSGLQTVIWNARNVQDLQYDVFNNILPFSGCDRLTDFVFGEEVEYIPDYLCYQLTSLKKLVIGNSVTTIGKRAFYECTGLTEVTISNSVTTIGERAFDSCTGLTEVTIPNSVTTIGQLAFNSCTGLQKVTIGNSVTTIGNFAFTSCTGLQKVTIGNSVTAIGYGAFYSCTGLTEVIWNARNAQDFQDNSSPFSGCDRLTDFVFGEKVEHIPAYLCYQLASLKKLVIGNSVTSIGKMAFSSCTGLTEVTIPNSVTTIGDGAFSGCTGLTEVTIPNSVTTIGDGAFSGCTGLTEVTIPNSVTSIGYVAFSGCTGLQKVIWNTRNAQCLQDKFIWSPFDNCDRLTDFIFGEEVEHIPAYLCYNLRLLNTIVIPNSVTTIGNGAFSSCYGLKTVTIGNSVTTIGNGAFDSCYGLKTVTIGNSVTTIGERAFDGCTGLTEVTIPNSVTNIGGLAFYRCTGLTEVTIPNSVTTIGNGAFNSCTGLKTVTIGNSVTIIENNAFKNCTQMESVTIGEKVESIGESAFAKCNSLTAVTSKAVTPPQIWATTFDDYAMTLYVPAGCKSKYAETEYWRNFTHIRETGVTLHTVTANATDETMGYVTGGGEYPQGGTATLVAVPFGQNYFVRWNDGNTDNPRTITVTGDMTFTAEFAPAGSAVETLENGERGIYATGRTLHVENGGESYRVYTAAGRLVYTGNDSSVTLSAPGMYIVRTSDRSQKVAVK